MTLDIPDLDDREFEDIVRDLRKRIPVYAPEWTDHNAHDPGITILELLAWLAETYGYQLDQVTDRHRRAYLRLLGDRPQPPTAATVHLSVAHHPGDSATPGDWAAAGTTISSGTKLVADDGTSAKKQFETTGPLVLTRASVACVVSTYRDGRSDNTTANAADGLSFQPFGSDAEPGSAMHLGFDADPFTGNSDVLDLHVAFAEEDVPQLAVHGDEPSTFEPSVCVEWQFLADGAWFDDDAWRPLSTQIDETGHLHSGGRIRLGRPEAESDSDTWAAWRLTPKNAVGVERPLFWIRAAVTLPERKTERPQIRPCGPDGRPVEPSSDPDDPDRLRYDLPPRLERLRVNVLEARHETTRADLDGLDPLQGVDGSPLTTARPNQRFVFPERPVLEATVTLRDPDKATDVVEWTPVEHLSSAGPHDPVYVLETAAGAVRFGDNLLGAAPPAGKAVVPTRVVTGGGTAGNVPASTRWAFAEEEKRPLESALVPLGAAMGGTDAEIVDEALVRVRRERRMSFRCVSLEDYRRVAVATPGLRFGRATAVVDSEPTPEGCAEHGRVRVVVVPFSTVDRPEPSRGFLDAVERHVCEHALLTDRVAVEPPTYVGVGVTAEIRIAPASDPTGRVEAVRDALDGFLAPLLGYEGNGWPFGRTVFRSEVYEVIADVPGVECAVDVDLAASGDGGRVGPEGDVDLEPTGLVYSLDHEVSIRTDRETCGDDYGGVS